jgi:Asp/Glu/hydantoin racemase
LPLVDIECVQGNADTGCVQARYNVCNFASKRFGVVVTTSGKLDMVA